MFNSVANENVLVRAITLTPLWLFIFSVNAPGAVAQRSQDPNLSHFYKARQQITITDDAPIINDKTGGKSGMSGGSGSLPNRPLPLPPARWEQYSPVETPSGLSTTVPKINTKTNKGSPGISTKHATALHGRSNKLNASASAAINPKDKSSKSASSAGKSATPAVSVYSPYKRYSLEPSATGATSAATESKARVRGNVLHWARAKQQGN